MRLTLENLPYRIKNRIGMLLSPIDKWIIRYVTYPFIKKKMSKFTILDSWQSIDYIKVHKCSLSRYGDGEIQVILGLGNGFQTPNKELGERLKEIFYANDAPNHIIGISKNFQTVDGLICPMNYWPIITVKYYSLLSNLLTTTKTYLNASFTRFYFEREDKSRSYEQLTKIREIWEDKDIAIVEGCKTRSGVGNDLYDNAKSIKRILGPATNAFDMYEDMLTAIKTYVENDTMVIMAYGMTATVLAYDLAKLGYWALDLGHLDIEYEWFRAGGMIRENINNKYINEIPNGDIVEDCKDPKYLSQIVCDLTCKEK